MNESFDPSEYLQEAFGAEGITLSAAQNAAFLAYAELLEQKNAVMNLTAITDFKDVVHKHFLDSCAPARLPWFAPEGREISLIDVGSGAGFPGIPLKILYPELKVTLLDSLQKRVNFLNEVIEALGLEGTEAIHARAEDGARREDLRERFDIAVSRAVAQLPVLAEYCLPYVKVGGSFLAYKGSGAEEEAEAAKGAVRRLGGGKTELTVFTLPGADKETLGRSLVRVIKTAPTPKKYPRKAGTAAKSPLA
ncbi:MAG: 16S rRNA (guanine(527)-N(7))-methyltransferase RsmG [Lachnospiraceae bacterium]|nr:16S rRNA (guanine(527)-N(7))-methyltransferase RsmG [Lachnospiraceae bacterium]